MNQTFRMFDKVVSVSDGCKLMIEEYFEGLNGKVIVIPNMIDIKSIKDKSELFNPYENDKDKIKLVTVGRLSKEKHIDNVVHISKELMKNTKPNFIWYIVGDGQEYQNINDLINEFGLENRIKLLGSKENPYPYILYSDILVHTSLVESQCITVLEGLTLNKPCVVTKSIGPSEFIVNKENGILTSDQPNEMADAILKLVNDNDFRKSIIEKSGNVIEERYIPEIVLEKIYRLIEGE